MLDENWAKSILGRVGQAYFNLICQDCGIGLPRQRYGTPRKLCDSCRRIHKLKNQSVAREKYKGHPPTKVYRLYTDAEISLMKQLWPTLTTIKVAHILKRHVSSVCDKARKLGLKRPKNFIRYVPRKMVIGTLKRGGHGVWMRKVADTGEAQKDWAYEHRLIWEKSNGPIGHRNMICFKDGDIDNLNIDNLERMSREDFMRRYNIHNLYPKELLEVIFMNGWLKRKIKEHV